VVPHDVLQVSGRLFGVVLQPIHQFSQSLHVGVILGEPEAPVQTVFIDPGAGELAQAVFVGELNMLKVIEYLGGNAEDR
jgi:hypothetical protein